ncbi:hypothetical protein FBULB1_9928 [Fusarium bulbicola]|nr:hypothetical protein FBULB1_9928 [Fusarium bulbicola]
MSQHTRNAQDDGHPVKGAQDPMLHSDMVCITIFRGEGIQKLASTFISKSRGVIAASPFSGKLNEVTAITTRGPNDEKAKTLSMLQASDLEYRAASWRQKAVAELHEAARWPASIATASTFQREALTYRHSVKSPQLRQLKKDCFKRYRQDRIVDGKLI